MRIALLGVLLSVLTAAPAGATTLEEGCANEVGVLCRNLHGSRLLACLDENRDAALAPCRDAMEAEHDRLDKERDAREAATQEERLRAELGEEVDARLTAVSGPAYVHTAAMPEGKFVKAEAGMPLSAGDLLRTGEGGTADLVFEGGSLVAVQSNSDLTVAALQPAETEFHLGLGRLIAKLAKVLQGRQVRFVTSNAVAAVRGTELAVDQPADRPTVVGVLDEGHVAVTAAPGGPEVMLAPNQETEVAKTGAPQAPKPLAALQSAKAAIGGVRARLAGAQKQWKPLEAKQRIAQRLELARRPALAAGKLAGVAAAQQSRTYPDAAARRTERRERTERLERPERSDRPERPERPERRRPERGGRRR